MNDFFNEKQPWSFFKHDILKKLVEHKVFSNGYQNFTYIDGLAGKGVYDSGEDGSPLVTLKIFDDLLNTRKDYEGEINALFFEENVDSQKKLEEVLNDNYSGNKHLNIITKQGDFYDLLDDALYYVDGNGLVFIDPFRFVEYKTEAIDKIKDFSIKADALIYFPIMGFRRTVGSAKTYEGSKRRVKDNLNIDAKPETEVTFQNYRSSLLEGFEGVNHIALKNSRNGELFRMILCTNDINMSMIYNDFEYNRREDMFNEKIVEDKILDLIPKDKGIHYKKILFNLTNNNFGLHKGRQYNDSLKSLLNREIICNTKNHNSKDELYNVEGIDSKYKYKRFFRRKK